MKLAKTSKQQDDLSFQHNQHQQRQITINNLLQDHLHAQITINITRPSNSTVNRHQTQTPLLPRPPMFKFPMNYHRVQGIPQPFITRPYLSIQYTHKQKILPQERNILPTCLPVITVMLTDQFLGVLVNQAKICQLTTSFYMFWYHQKTQVMIVFTRRCRWRWWKWKQ